MALASSPSVPLARYTTLGLGGPAARLAEAGTAQDVIGAVTAADKAREPLLVLGGGSNLVVADEGFPGTAVKVATAGVRCVRDRSSGSGERVMVTAAAGESWDGLVSWAVAEKLAGIECLAGIPGLVGATPIQNVGAYGQEVAQVIDAVGALDRATGEVLTMRGPALGFGYRTSVFKSMPWPPAGPAGPSGRYVVLDVTFALARDPMSVPVRYAELARRLGVEGGDRAPLGDVARAVLGLRRGKGMVLDPADPDTRSAGSFFTNPALGAAEFAALQRQAGRRGSGAAVPCFPAPGGLVKVPAAWLIEQAGFGKGYPGSGAARISSKHTLALTNRGSATTAELVALARQIAAGVRAAFGIELVSEPVLVGVSL